MIETLDKSLVTGKLLPLDIQYIEDVTQEDIKRAMRFLSIKTTQDRSHIIHQSTNISYPWDINNHQILKNTLEGKYNSSEYVLYLEHKE